MDSKTETELIELIKQLIECGNAMHDKTALFKCSIHYKQELQNWKDLVNGL